MDFQGKMKAVTFSFDDAVVQDRRLVSLFDRYGLRATFNLNSGLFGRACRISGGTDIWFDHIRVCPDEARTLYRNHEVAVHTKTHPNLTRLTDNQIVRQVEQDRIALSDLTGQQVVGMAYPCGGVNHDERVERILKEQTKVQYARTITSTGSFDPQEDLLCFNPTVYHRDMKKMFALGREFIELTPETPQLFYIWGHSYELDLFDLWADFEDFLRLISRRSDIFYGTNREVFGL